MGSPYRRAAEIEPDPPAPEPPEIELDEVPPASVPVAEPTEPIVMIAGIIGLMYLVGFCWAMTRGWLLPMK